MRANVTCRRHQILGFALPEGEIMSRAEFRRDLQRPLANRLETLKLWRIGRGELPGTNGIRVRVSRKVISSKIRYAVLCYECAENFPRPGFSGG